MTWWKPWTWNNHKVEDWPVGGTVIIQRGKGGQFHVHTDDDSIDIFFVDELQTGEDRVYAYGLDNVVPYETLEAILSDSPIGKLDDGAAHVRAMVQVRKQQGRGHVEIVQ